MYDYVYSFEFTTALFSIQIVKESAYMTQEELDIYFPYALIREAYNQVYKVSGSQRSYK